MVKQNGRDYIYLVWKENVSRRNYLVGQLSKNGIFEFGYGFEVQDAMKKGFTPLISFDDIRETYSNNILFPVFSSRLPDRKRRNIELILKKYNLENYDEYELLKKSGGKLPIDNLEFIDPIPLELENKEITRTFFIAGTRHCLECKGDDCTKTPDVEVGDNLFLEEEPDNIHDENAIKVLDKDNVHVGYIPRYYCEAIKNAFKKDYSYKCIVKEFNKNNNCNECIKIEFILDK